MSTLQAEATANANVLPLINRLRVAIDARYVNQTEAAKACGMSQQSLSQFLNGKSAMRWDSLMRIAAAIGDDAPDMIREAVADSLK